MIFVTTGTVGFPFRRLIDEVVEMALTLNSVDFVVQDNYRPLTVPQNVIIRSYYPFSETLKLYRTADIVITAGGEASVLLASRYAKRTPIVVPRQRRYGEHVDDQQVEVGRYVMSHDLGIVVDKMSDLRKAISRVRLIVRNESLKKHSSSSLIDNLGIWMKKDSLK